MLEKALLVQLVLMVMPSVFSQDHKTFVLTDGASGACEEGKVGIANLCVKTILFLNLDESQRTI